MRTVHRLISIFLVVFVLYLGVTGTLIQVVDLRTLFMKVPATDPNMMAIREGLNGTSDFQVIGTSDYAAPVLPMNLHLTAAMQRALGTARAKLDDEPLQYVELRMADGRPVVQAKSNDRLLTIDATTGEFLEEGKPSRADGGTFGRSQRNTLKGLHRLTSIGEWMLWVNILVGLALCAMIVTGLIVYLRLLEARKRINKPGLFWSAGGTWRSLHRAISLLSAAFVLVVALSGTWLAVESVGRSIMGVKERAMVAQGIRIEDPGSPLVDEVLPGPLNTTLRAYRAMLGDEARIRVVRLRIYGGMPQGVVVTGEDEARQLVFNSLTGRRVGLTEPGYPPQHFPFGWQAHQIAKQIHRGDFIGMSGRWMDLFAGLSLIYLTISGAVMYFQLWTKRQSTGRSALLWK